MRLVPLVGVVAQEVLRGAVCVDERKSERSEVNVGCQMWAARDHAH